MTLKKQSVENRDGDHTSYFTQLKEDKDWDTGCWQRKEGAFLIDTHGCCLPSATLLICSQERCTCDVIESQEFEIT